MASSGVSLVEYQTEDGVVFHLKVSPEIALALKDDGAKLKEVTFTDMGGRFVLDDRLAHRRIDQRPMPTGEPWEGPRFHFELLLGEGRSTWLGGGAVDKQGRCGLCHGHRLPGYVYCLNCDRSGRDKEIPKATRKPPEPAPPEDDGHGGGTGPAMPAKVETRREKRARLAEERKAG